MSSKIIIKTQKTQNLEKDVKEKELEFELIKEALEKKNIDLLIKFRTKNLKSSTKIPKKLSEKEQEKREEIRRLKEAENLEKIQQVLFRQAKGKRTIKPLYKNNLYKNVDVFGKNIQDVCQKILIKEEKNKHNLNKSENIVENKSVLLNCKKNDDLDEKKDKEFLQQLDMEMKLFYLKKCGKIFNFLKDIHLSRYIDDFLKEGYDLYEEFIEIPDDFFHKKTSPFLNVFQQNKFFNKLHNIQNIHNLKINYSQNNFINKFNFDKNIPTNKIIGSQNNNINPKSCNNNLNVPQTNGEDIVPEEKNIIKNNNKIIKETSSKLSKEELAYITNHELEKLEKKREEEFSKIVEDWRNFRPKSSKKNEEDKLYCWNCYTKFDKKEGLTKEFTNDYNLNSKYNTKNFCSIKCLNDFVNKKEKYMCFYCKKMFKEEERFGEQKFCSKECMMKYKNMIEESNKKTKDINIKNQKDNIQKEIEEDNEEKDNYDPMEDF